jgi:Zn-finger nucleic acid-binding protein
VAGKIIIIVLLNALFLAFAIAWRWHLVSRWREKGRSRLWRGRSRLRRKAAKEQKPLDGVLDNVQTGKLLERFCPKCEIVLESKSLGGLPLLRCKRCKGIFSSLDVLEHALASLAKPTDEELPGELVEYLRMEGEKRQGTRNCPVCTTKMVKKAYPSLDGMALDFCWPCQSAWFDGGELQNLARFDPETGELPDDGKKSRKELGQIKVYQARASGERTGEAGQRPGDVDYMLMPFLNRYRGAKMRARARRRRKKGKRS